jgi:excisionase family DNA binding protein
MPGVLESTLEADDGYSKGRCRTRGEGRPRQQQRKRKMLKKSPVSVMTVREFAAFLNVHPGTVYRLASRGDLPGFKLGGGWRFSTAAVNSWMKKQQKNVA